MIIKTLIKPAVLAVLAFASASAHAAEADNPARGEKYFQACAACHSLAPNHNMTGPSLAGVIGRKAGTLASFQRYSPVLKSSNVAWNEQTLDPWLKEPSQFIPSTTMTFRGIPQPAIRADLIAYLKQATTSPVAEQGPPVGAPGDSDLKKLGMRN